MLIVTPSDFNASPTAASTLLQWASTADGQRVDDHGECALSLLPRDDDLVLVLPPRALSWHRIALPRVNAARLRAALDGLLEDRVLGDVEALHHALAPGGKPGETVWVASGDKSRLRAWVHLLEKSGRSVSRIAPSLWPLLESPVPVAAAGVSRSFGFDEPTNLHWVHADGDQVWLCSASVLGVSCVPLPDGLSSPPPMGALLPAGNDPASPAGSFDTWMADPALAAMAEGLFNRRFEPVAPSAWLLRAGQTDWNLAQFDLSLSSKARRTQRFKRLWRDFRRAPAWRAARWGLAAMVAVQIAGLNAAAWQERSSLQAKQQAVRDTLQQTFPQVTLVLDAPVQMQREVARLQQASGQLAAGDLESLLAAIDQAAAGEPLSATQIAYTPGEGRFGGWRASEDQVRAMQQTLQRGGWRARFDGNELALQAPQP